MSRSSYPPPLLTDSAAHGNNARTLGAPAPLAASPAQRLLALCEALHFGNARATEVESVFRTFVVPWARLGGRSSSSDAAVGASELGAGNALVELGVTLSPVGSTLSVLFTPLAEPTAPHSSYATGLAMFAEAARTFGASLRRLDLLDDLSEKLQESCALSSAIAFAPGKRPAFKAYLRPRPNAAGPARALIESALSRLGMSHAATHAAQTMMPRGPGRDELDYLAFDLSDDPLSGVELCVRHHDWTLDDHDREVHIDGHTPRGAVAPFVAAMTGTRGLVAGSATSTSAAFLAGSPGIAPVTTHYVPIAAYAESDAIARDRVESYLSGGALNAAPYRRALDAFLDGPLESSHGVQRYVAVTWCNGVPRFTFRLAAGRELGFSAVSR